MFDMWKHGWKRLTSIVQTRHRLGGGGRRTATFRPTLTALEDRTLPAVSLLRTFAGMTSVAGGGYEPPDTVLAVGPNHVVEAVNSAVAIYTKAGALVSTQPFSTFFGVPANAFVFDPVASYDELAGRFVVAALLLDDTTQTSSLLLAVSNSANPTAGFTERQQINIRQTVAGTNLWGDYPKLGWNRNAYVFTFNMFSFPSTTGTFTQAQVLVVNKPTVLDNNVGTIQTFSSTRTTGDFTLAAAVMHAAPAGGPMYFVEASPTPNNIRVVRMTNVVSATPTFTNFDIPVAAYGVAPNAPQPAPGAVLDTVPIRMLNAEWRGNRLVATHTVGVGGKAVARWYEVNTAVATPTLTQQGNIDPGAGIYTWTGSIAIAPNGSLGMTFLQSSATQFLSMYVTGRTRTDPLGVMQAPVLVRAGQAAYIGGGPPERSGDYSGIGIDPVNSTFWAANEFAPVGAAPNWGTWIANFAFNAAGIGGNGLLLGVTEPNETEDQATNLGPLYGTRSISNQNILYNRLRMPDYDWYTFRAGTSGNLSVIQRVTAGGPLELQLYYRVGNYLIKLGKTVTSAGQTRTLTARVAAGTQLYVLVKGAQSVPGLFHTGFYGLDLSLT